MATECSCCGHFIQTPTGLDWHVTVADPECPFVIHRAVA